jgi:hypothetical protein
MHLLPAFLSVSRPARRAVSLGALSTLCIACGCGAGSIQKTPAAPTPTAVQAGPQLGYAWKSADQTLRPILGVLGSSQTGASIVTPTTFVTAASSSTAGIALLIGADQQVYRMTLPNGTPTPITLTSGTGLTTKAGAKIRFSPSGTSALVFVPGSLTASVLTNPASTPQVRSISVATPLVDMAASDAGVVVALSQAATGTTLSMLPATGIPQILATLKGGGGLSFVGTGDTLLAADSVANTLTQVQAVSTAPSVTQLATANLLKSPVAVGAALTGRWAVVANASESSVVRIDLTGATAPQRIACPSQPDMAERLTGSGVFRFNEIGATPTWIADMTAPTPSMLFIPASQ